jgi:hypothetical protein
VSGYYGNDAEITVPEKLGGYTVTALGGGWYESGGEIVLYGNIHEVVYADDGSVSDCKVYSPFSDNADITSVTLPDSVTSVGSISFENCTSLESVTFGENVVIIGSGCFEGCTSLGSFSVPDSVVFIDQQAFSGCTALTELTIGSQSVCGTAAFENCTSLESVEIPASWGTVPYQAFSGCSSLKSVSVADGISEISANAFEGCTSLIGIVLPDSVTAVHSDAFNGCISLESVKLGSALDTLGNRAFAGCGLKTLTVPDTLVRIGENAFGTDSDGNINPDFTLDCGMYSAAEAYAEENGIACTTAASAETELTSMPVRQKLANGNGAFTAALVSLLIIAAVIAVLIILTVKNRGTGDEETAEPNADENKSAAENANQPASADSPK